jgi:hypothetical protein
MNRRVLKPLLSLLVLAVAGFLTFLVITPAPAAVLPAPAITVPINEPGGNESGPTPTPSKTKAAASPSATPSADPSAPPGGAEDKPEAAPTKPCAECQPET